jgi:methylenetetrahydrofolate--tRNA-(uracil-5-)-methyltransferase
MTVTVIGGGLAGCEAARALSRQGISVRLCEMKPARYTPAHSYPGLGELVCSNSLKAARIGSAGGMLKEELRILGSLIIEAADHTAVPAGGALAVDREEFSDYITAKIKADPNITLVEGEVTTLPDGPVVVATGPLTTEALSEAIARLIGEDYLSFYDAAAPIITADSIDYTKVFAAARYGRGEDDYLNCPLDKQPYLDLVEALRTAERAPVHGVDSQTPLKVYEGCMPVEVLAARGVDTLRYGPLKPMGLINPADGRRPYAVVQLRRENREGSLYNLVGFQTNLRFGEQKRVFSMIPGLERAEFVRYGVMHRNTFMNSPRLLEPTFRLKGGRPLYFAGQLTGVEGYVESSMSGLIAGLNMGRELRGLPPFMPGPLTMSGALCRYISDPDIKNFQPMGASMGLLPPLEEKERDRQRRYQLLAERGLKNLKEQLATDI